MVLALHPAVGSAARRPAVSTLVITLILLFFTMIMGVTFGSTLVDRVTASLEIMEGEVVAASAIHRDDVLHVRINFKHVLGSGFDRVAVSDLVVGGAHVNRDGAPLDAEHPNLNYLAEGWTWRDGSACASWTVVVLPWPSPPSAWTMPTNHCQMDIYQRIDDGDAIQDRLNLGEGNTAALEFVLVGVDPPPDGLLGVTVEYGLFDRTEVTGDANAALYVHGP